MSNSTDALLSPVLLHTSVDHSFAWSGRLVVGGVSIVAGALFSGESAPEGRGRRSAARIDGTAKRSRKATVRACEMRKRLRPGQQPGAATARPIARRLPSAEGGQFSTGRPGAASAVTWPCRGSPMEATAAAPSGATQTGQRNILVVFSGLMLAVLLASLDSTIVATALPTIVGDLGGFNHLSWVVTSYLLAQTVVTPLYGKLGDIYGRKIVIQIAIVIFLVGSALCGLSQNLTELVIFRGIQGIGGGGLTVLAAA